MTLEPAPAWLHEAGAYGGGQPRLHRLVGPLLSGFDRQRLSMLRSVAPPARLLDVGAGRGRFVQSARAAGYDAAGIEPSSRGVAAARALRAPVARAGVLEAEVADGSLPAVTLWHVLEHLEDPGAALSRIRSWLVPGGTLLIGVPNLSSAQARLGGPGRWYHLDVPRHRVHFTTAGLHALLARQGYEVVRTHHVLAEHNPFGMWQTALNGFTSTPSYLYNLLKRNAPVRSRDLLITLLGLALAPLALAAEMVAGALRHGGTIAVLARRPGEDGLGVR